ARTYYVTKNGSDSNTGLDWGHSWSTVAKVNSTVVHGDTVRFGTGNWYGSQIVPPTGSTTAAPTVYACSTLTAATQGLSQIWSGDVVTGWSQYSGNVYQASWTPSNSNINWSTGYPCIVQSDSLLAPAGSLGGITRAGLYYYNGSTLYIWPYNNGNPGAAGRTILASAREVVRFWSGQDHIVFFGLGLKMGVQGTIYFSESPADSNSFIHCNLAHVNHDANNNSSIIFFADLGPGSNIWNYGNSFVACNIYAATADGGGSFNHLGNGVSLYSCRQTHFDSCYFTQIPGDGVHIKQGYAAYPAYGNRVAYSTFNGRGNTYDGRNQFQESMVQMSCFSDRDSVYGCIFDTDNPSYGGDHTVGGRAISLSGNICYQHHNYGGQFVCNNTFYNCNTFIDFNTDLADQNMTFKYNVGYDVAGPNWIWFEDNTNMSRAQFDSNYWYDPSTAFNGRYNATDHNWSAWHTGGFDVRGFNSNPSLANPAGGDFSRPAVTEMNRTYGGRNWTKFGAVQGITPPDVTPPVISGRSITNITTTGATFVWLTDESAHSAVDIGTTTSYGRTDSNLVLTTVHSVTISGLSPATGYHFRFRSRDAAGNATTSSDSTFSTLTPDLTPPVISARTVTAVGANSATIGWTTDEASHTAVDIGLNTSYGRTDSSLNMVTSHSITLNSLVPATTYHFRVRSRDAAGNTGTSADSTFITTADVTPPVITTRTVTSIGRNTATIGWTTNEASQTAVDIGINTSYGRTDSSIVLVTAHSIVINSLTSGTLYHFRVRSRDAYNNASTSGDSTFTTSSPSDTIPPVLTNIVSSGITDHTVMITWNSNEAATSQLDYGLSLSYGSSTTLDPALVTAHTVNLTGLTADTLYHFRVRSRDASANEAISGDFNFRTLVAPSLENVSFGLRDSVSSTYPGYLPDRINDGVINPRGGISTTWASDESSTSPHWIVLYFDSLRTVNMAKIYWAWNSGSSNWMCSQQFNIQYWNQGTGAYVNAASVTNTTADSITTVQFSTVSTTRIRYYQPANMGPTSYPSVIWLTEFSLSGPSIPPAAVDDLGMLPWNSFQQPIFELRIKGMPSFHERQNYLGD
ncbi:MAG TPA: hypothetical protein DEO84_02510, partial [candidate division Zixibacteria bacterium]|nr:hypothetical protein [candidate division Zixibacteria bacterium]